MSRAHRRARTQALPQGAQPPCPQHFWTVPELGQPRPCCWHHAIDGTRIQRRCCRCGTAQTSQNEILEEPAPTNPAVMAALVAEIGHAYPELAVSA